jgi:glycosyltransferase involved in cell wall biosynthesis
VLEWGSEDQLADIVRGRANASQTKEHRRVTLPLTSRTAPVRGSKITVGIPVFGDAPYLDELVESVMHQTRGPHEVVVVSDGSVSEDVERKIDHWNDAIAGGVVHVRQSHRGVCVARNSILEVMTGDAVMLVDQDDLLDARALEFLGKALRSNPDHAAIACWTEFFGEYNAIEAKPPFDPRIGTRENPIISTAALVDRSAIGDDVRFEPDLAFLYCEDWNFWADLVAAGHTFGLVPVPLVRHRVHPASGGFRRTDLALRVGRDRARMKLKQAPGLPMV